MFALFGVYLGSMPMRFGVLCFVWVCQPVHLTICQAPDDGPDVFEGEARHRFILVTGSTQCL